MNLRRSDTFPEKLFSFQILEKSCQVDNSINPGKLPVDLLEFSGLTPISPKMIHSETRPRVKTFWSESHFIQ